MNQEDGIDLTWSILVTWIGAWIGVLLGELISNVRRKYRGLFYSFRELYNLYDYEAIISKRNYRKAR